MRIVFVVLRLAVGIAIAVAVIAQMLHSIEFLRVDPDFDLGFYITNYFSFFTIDSNSASVVVLLVGAVLLVRPGPDPLLFTTVRAAVVSYMVVTGIVYNLLLRNIELPQGQTLEWSNEILHVIGPVYLLVDWLFAPGRSPLATKRLWAIIAFPIVWVIYTLIRGAAVIDPLTGDRWYPYPFLDPINSQNGYLSVSFYVVLIALVISAVGAGVIWLSRRGDPVASDGTALPRRRVPLVARDERDRPPA